LEENEQNGDAADSLIQHVSVSIYKANDDSRASSSFTTVPDIQASDIQASDIQASALKVPAQ
jgi:hypothetical protein